MKLRISDGEVCPLTRHIGLGTVSVVLHCPRSTLHQSTITAQSDFEFIQQARFAPGWNLGEGGGDRLNIDYSAVGEKKQMRWAKSPHLLDS
jgi:hypothetical protein